MSSKKEECLTTVKIEAYTKLRLNQLKTLFAAFNKQLEIFEKNGLVFRKSAAISIEARNAGNQLYIEKGHDAHVHKDILLHYSRSIAFAPKGTEELALGYSNRSILLMHLHRYKESLVDINRALECSKSEAFKRQLHERKKKCLGLINEEILNELAKTLNSHNVVVQESLDLKFKNMKCSTVVPSAADCVSLVYNEEYGRHLVATRDIEPGEILIVERGFACYPLQNQIYLVCSHCLQIAWNGIPCDNCTFTVYCSNTCMNEALKEYHDIECPMVQYMDCFLNVNKMFDRMPAVRLLITAVKQEGFENIIREASNKPVGKEDLNSLLSGGILHSNRFKSYYNLLSHAEFIERNKEDDDMWESIIVYLLSEHTDFLLIGKDSDRNGVTEPHVLLIIKDILTKLKYILDINAFWYQAPLDCECEAISNCKGTCNSSRGTILAANCSLLNHSCTPNVSRLHVPKRKCVVFANGPIKRGEQLCDSYGVTCIKDVKVRQNLLQTNFHFTCKCMACKDNFTMIEAPDTTKEDWSKVMTEFQKCFPTSMENSFFVDPVYQCELSEEILKYVEKMSELYYKHLDRYSAFGHNLKARAYIERWLLKLYGEKYVIPKDC